MCKESFLNFKENHNNLKDSHSKRVRSNHKDAKIFLKSAKIYDKLVKEYFSKENNIPLIGTQVSYMCAKNHFKENHNNLKDSFEESSI